MVMRPQNVIGTQVGGDRFLVAGRMFHDFAAAANTLIRLNVGAGRYFLQENLDGFAAVLAFEGQDTGGFVDHDANFPNNLFILWPAQVCALAEIAATILISNATMK